MGLDGLTTLMRVVRLACIAGLVGLVLGTLYLGEPANHSYQLGTVDSHAEIAPVSHPELTRLSTLDACDPPIVFLSGQSQICGPMEISGYGP